MPINGMGSQFALTIIINLMDEDQVIEMITEAIYDADLNEDCDIRTFADAMLMTSNKGIVLKFKDGTEFQVQVLQSR